MGPDDGIMAIDFSATLSQIPDQFFAGLELSACRLIPVEVADQANAKGNVVQVIAVDMAAVDLAAPAVAHFDLAVAGRSPIANDKVISKPVLHPPDMSMVIIEDSRVTLARAAIMDNNKLPTAPLNRCSADLFDHRTGKVAITFARPRP